MIDLNGMTVAFEDVSSRAANDRNFSGNPQDCTVSAGVRIITSSIVAGQIASTVRLVVRVSDAMYPLLARRASADEVIVSEVASDEQVFGTTYLAIDPITPRRRESKAGVRVRPRADRR